MTPRELMRHVEELVADNLPPIIQPFEIPADGLFTVPQLLHIKVGLDRALLDAIGDEKTPCPHNGNGNWRSIYDEVERCGQCGRKMEAVNERNNAGPEEGISNEAL